MVREPTRTRRVDAGYDFHHAWGRRLIVLRSFNDVDWRKAASMRRCIHAAAGWIDNNAERLRDGMSALGFAAYLISGAFISSVFESWESEFLQMGAYVVLTGCLFQRGSPESKHPDKSTPQDRDPHWTPMRRTRQARPIRRSGAQGLCAFSQIGVGGVVPGVVRAPCARQRRRCSRERCCARRSASDVYRPSGIRPVLV